MLKEPALSLHAPDLNISSLLVFCCQHQSPRNSLRDRAEDRLGVGGLPLCRCERCGCDKLPHRFFLFLDRRLSSTWRCRRASHIQKPRGGRHPSSARLNFIFGTANKNRSLCVSTTLLVLFVFRASVGFPHDIAPGAQRFGDAGKPCFFGGRKPVHMVADFVEHIDDVVDRSSVSETSIVVVFFSSSPLEKKSAADRLRVGLFSPVNCSARACRRCRTPSISAPMVE